MSGVSFQWVILVQRVLCAIAVTLCASSVMAQSCPPSGWQENLINYQNPDSQFPTDDTANLPTPDCNFHEWSWEAFVWATALDADGVPRFMALNTPAELSGKLATSKGPKLLRLAQRPLVAAGLTESAGAIVEADGNMLVAPNGYPVYASVHMNDSYFNTAKGNLISTGDYQKNPDSVYFDVGAAVFKATWLRLDDGQAPPDGAFTTLAEVPVLKVFRTNPASVVPNGETTTVTVALVGLHVVGYTENHPEFLWGTFEHKDNTPQFKDGTFDPTSTASDSQNYTFYHGGTPWNNINYNQGNQANPFLLAFDAKTQKFKTVTVPDNATGMTTPLTSPGTNAVLANQTGGENQPGGPANIASINAQGQEFLANQKGAQSKFANYFLGGTVWMPPNTYSVNSTNNDAVGSIRLANSTAETFFQLPQGNSNCFLCHNAQSYSFQTPPPAKLTPRRIAISHVLSVGSDYEVPNLIHIRSPKGAGLVPGMTEEK